MSSYIIRVCTDLEPRLGSGFLSTELLFSPSENHREPAADKLLLVDGYAYFPEGVSADSLLLGDHHPEKDSLDFDNS